MFCTLSAGYVLIVREVVFLRTLRSFKKDKSDIEIEVLLQRILDLYMALVTLEERIAGNLPAFEGILIVKERKNTH